MLCYRMTDTRRSALLAYWAATTAGRQFAERCRIRIWCAAEPVRNERRSGQLTAFVALRGAAMLRVSGHFCDFGAIRCAVGGVRFIAIGARRGAAVIRVCGRCRGFGAIRCAVGGFVCWSRSLAADRAYYARSAERVISALLRGRLRGFSGSERCACYCAKFAIICLLKAFCFCTFDFCI
jgi:hypothetical protein